LRPPKKGEESRCRLRLPHTEKGLASSSGNALVYPAARSRPSHRDSGRSRRHSQSHLRSAPLHGLRRLPRPIREQREQRALYAEIGTAPQPYRLITLLRETGMRVGEVLDLRWGDVILDSGREALRFRGAEERLGAHRRVRADRDSAGTAGTTRRSVVGLWRRGSPVRNQALTQPRAE
jgi:integrase